ncbi:MAG: PAS domain-containing protein, partial [Limisphaerales bacterium]
LQQSVANYKRTEERLRKSEERFKLIADNAADLIMVLDTEGKPEYFSPSVKYTLGHDLESAGKKPVFEWVHPEDRESMMASVSASINNSECQLMEFRVQHRAGAWRHLEARICAIRDKTDQRPHLVIVGRDLSEKKEMESQTAFLTKQLLDAREKVQEDEAAEIMTQLESPLKSLSARIQFVHDAVGKLTPLLEQQQEIAEKAAAKVDTETMELKSKLPEAITESLENVELISKMIADLKRSAAKE